FQAEDGIRDATVTGVQTCALPIYIHHVADGEGGGGPSLGDVVNVAKTAWEIMKDGRPVVNATTDFANAVPSGVPWSALTGWALEPMALRWRYHTENALGFNDTDIYFKLKWHYNGRHSGHGPFINPATCII